MLGMHLIISAYGFWPPNDPRGSWSTSVRAQHLYEIGGEATKVATRQSVARRPHDQNLRQQIKENLKYPPVTLTGVQARAVARGIADVCPKIDLVTHAFAVLPDHFHLVVRNHPFDPDELIACLQRAATRGLNKEGLHPLRNNPRPNGRLPSPWAAKGWKVFLDTPEDMRRAIRYVEENPERAGLPRQRWSFVVPFEG